MVIEWLSWLLYKSSFINSNILETSTDRPNNPPSFKFLEQRVHELVGRGSTEPPLDNGVGSKMLRSGSVYLMCFSKIGFFSRHATYTLVIIAPGAGRTQQLGFDYLYF